MDETSPAFGRQTTTNPFAWKIRSDVAQLDASATAYRVRDRDGAVLLDWTSSAPDGDGVYSVELHRNGDHPIPKLGTEASELHLEMRFRSTGGNESIVSTCWNNVPMAAPLAVAAGAARRVVRDESTCRLRAIAADQHGIAHGQRRYRGRRLRDHPTDG